MHCLTVPTKLLPHLDNIQEIQVGNFAGEVSLESLVKLEANYLMVLELLLHKQSLLFGGGKGNPSKKSIAFLQHANKLIMKALRLIRMLLISTTAVQDAENMSDKSTLLEVVCATLLKALFIIHNNQKKTGKNALLSETLVSILTENIGYNEYGPKVKGSVGKNTEIEEGQNVTDEEIGFFFEDRHGPTILGTIAEQLANGGRVPSMKNQAWRLIAEVQLKEITECFNEAEWDNHAVNLRNREEAADPEGIETSTGERYDLLSDGTVSAKPFNGQPNGSVQPVNDDMQQEGIDK